MGYGIERDADGNESVPCKLRGRTLLSHGMFNKGTAFTDDEREALRAMGYLQ